MSGIEELKQKTKLSMDEMYEDKPVGILENKTAGQPDNQLSSQTTKHISSPKENSKSAQTKNHTPRLPETQQAKKKPIQTTHSPENQTPSKTENQENSLFTHPNAKHSLFQTLPKPQKIPTCKMTFNLTEDIYKAFNDLYAKRMLKGRKTEKSELICEAIQWLIKMEEDVTP